MPISPHSTLSAFKMSRIINETLVLPFVPVTPIIESDSQAEEKKAVEAGYWHLYRYNPAVTEGNPFTLDSKDPTMSYQDFLMGETRYTSLKKAQPELAAELFERAEEENGARLAKYKNLAKKD